MTKSVTDPECGLFVKGDHKRQFAYEAHTACDKNGFIMETDAKEKYAMWYTQYRGLAQVTNWVKLKFAAMNLKKLAKWKWNTRYHFFFPFLFPPNILKTRLPLDLQPSFSTG